MIVRKAIWKVLLTVWKEKMKKITLKTGVSMLMPDIWSLFQGAMHTGQTMKAVINHRTKMLSMRELTTVNSTKIPTKVFLVSFLQPTHHHLPSLPNKSLEAHLLSSQQQHTTKTCTVSFKNHSMMPVPLPLFKVTPTASPLY